MIRPGTVLTATVLAGLAGLHVAWGVGVSFPARDRSGLADAIAGTDAVPPPRDCLAVGSLLATASGLVVAGGRLPRPVRRLGVITLAGVLAVRGVLGLLGRTSALVPWEPSRRFVELDRRYYGPLCLALAVGACSSLRR